MTNEYKDHPHRVPYHHRKSTNAGKGGDASASSKTFAFESSGPAGKIRGTALQLIEKYGAFARDAQREGDSVLSQNFLQHAEHYRILSSAQNVPTHSHTSPPRTPHTPQNTPLSEKREPQYSTDEEKEHVVEKEKGAASELPLQDETFEPQHIRTSRISKNIPHINRPKILRNSKKTSSTTLLSKESE